MKRLHLTRAAVFFLAIACTIQARADHDSISVFSGDKSGDWSLTRIKTELAADITTIDYVGHDGKHTSSAVPLASLLKAAGVPVELTNPKKGVDPKEKHAELHLAITVQGRDGYYTVFSIAELMPELTSKKVWLALDVDGKPWPDTEAPMKLVVKDDEKPARWVHSVQTITVVKIEPPATQPAK
jgi:hypothetical protein